MPCIGEVPKDAGRTQGRCNAQGVFAGCLLAACYGCTLPAKSWWPLGSSTGGSPLRCRSTRERDGRLWGDGASHARQGSVSVYVS